MTNRARGIWSVSTWQHKNGDQFCVGLMVKPRKLKTEAELSEIKSFASSSSPKWIETPAFSPDAHVGSGLQFLKMDRETFDVRDRSGDRYTCPVLSYFGVFESDAKPFMVAGIVVCIDENTFLLQHNSTRPISDKLVAKAFPAILEYARVQPVDAD